MAAQQTVKSPSQRFRSSGKADRLLLGSLPCLWGSVWTSESKDERKQPGKGAEHLTWPPAACDVGRRQFGS